MADNENLQSRKHYTDHCHNHSQYMYSTQAFSQIHSAKLFQQKLYKTHTTSGTSDMLTANIMIAKIGYVTTFSSRNILVMKGYLQL